jgi:hypothetical protein
MRLSMLALLLAGSAWGQVPKISAVSASGNSPSSLLVRWATDLAKLLAGQVRHDAWRAVSLLVGERVYGLGGALESAGREAMRMA